MRIHCFMIDVLMGETVWMAEQTMGVPLRGGLRFLLIAAEQERSAIREGVLRRLAADSDSGF
jgi:hypothetical protein